MYMYINIYLSIFNKYYLYTNIYFNINLYICCRVSAKIVHNQVIRFITKRTRTPYYKHGYYTY